MKILILASGGDCAGMNMCVYELIKRLKSHDLYYSYRGYQGLIEDDVKEADFLLAKKWKDEGGIFIKSSRSKDFMTKKGFSIAVENLKKHQIDKIVILGGNGTYEGAKRLSEFVSVVFIPATIDNDFTGSDYTLGHETAIVNAVNNIENIKSTFYSFDRVGIYEVMGRDCLNIAMEVGEKVNADIVITKKPNLKNIAKKLNNCDYSEKSPIIIIKEYICDIKELAKGIQTLINKEVKTVVLGYIQRGGKPVKQDKIMAKLFAQTASKNIEKNNIVVISEKNKIKTLNI